MTPLLALAAVAVGFSIGLVGIGGIFLLPVLVFGAHMRVETAIGTALFTFVFTGIFATALYARSGRIDWRIALWISAGSALAAPLGARVSVALPDTTVKALLAFFLIAVGLTTLLRPGGGAAPRLAPSIAALTACGIVVGFGAGLTGVGGPAILVPLLMVLGFPATLAVAVSQPNQIIASVTGAAGHALFGNLDLRFAVFLTVFEVAGVVAGALIGTRTDALRLRPLAALASIAAGAWTAIRTILPA